MKIVYICGIMFILLKVIGERMKKMGDFVIIPDSGCDLTTALRNRFGIDDILLGVVYYPDGHQEYVDVDWEKMSPKEYYDSMKGRNVLYKTAYAPAGEVEAKFEKYLKEGKDILSISLSSGISGTFQAVSLVAKGLMERYPERKIVCVDSLRYSGAFSLLVLKAAEKRAEGATIEETAQYINSIKNTVHQMGPLDDLFFCAKTGRINNFQAFFGGLVGVLPMADFNANGVSDVIVKVKGKKTAYNVTLEYVKNMIIDGENQTLFISHSDREAEAKLLADMLQKQINPKDIIINDVGMSCGSSIGPGLCAVYFMGKELGNNLDAERELMKKITGK